MTGRRQPRPPRLIIPVGALDRRVVGECYVCGDPVYAGDEAHIGACARAALAEIQAEREARRKRLAIFEPGSWDPELRAHMDRVGERMKREGRLVVKKNERGGF